MKSAIRMTSACVSVLFFAGCMQARIEESREMATPIAKGERVVILAKPQIEGSGAEDEYNALPFNFQVWQIRCPAITSRPLVLCRLHDFPLNQNEEDDRTASLVNRIGYSFRIGV